MDSNSGPLESETSAVTTTLLNLLEFDLDALYVRISVTSKKSPNVYKSWPKMISLEKLKISNIYKNVGDLGKLIVAKGFEKLPKVQ